MNSYLPIHVSIVKILFALVLLAVSSSTFAEFMRVTLLGTGSPRTDAHRAGPAVLVEAGGKYLLFDAGRTVVQQIRRLDVPISEVQQVFLTHLHSDHISALDDIWMTGWIYQRPQPLRVYGPTGTKSFTQYLQQAYAYDASIRQQHAGLPEHAATLTATEIKPGAVYADNALKVTAFLVDHKPVEPAYGYRISFGDRSVVISGDTTYSKNLVEHAQGADVLIHEIFAAPDAILERNPRLQRIARYHTSPDQLAIVLNKVQPRLAVLTHVILVGIEASSLMTRLHDSYGGEIRMGEDLMRIEISSDIKVVPFTVGY